LSGGLEGPPAAEPEARVLPQFAQNRAPVWAGEPQDGQDGPEVTTELNGAGWRPSHVVSRRVPAERSAAVVGRRRRECLSSALVGCSLRPDRRGEERDHRKRNERHHPPDADEQAERGDALLHDPE